MTVEWTDWELVPAPPVAEDRVAEVEAALGVTFPEDFLAVVREHQGATPEPEGVPLPDGTNTVFNSLMHFEDQPRVTSLPSHAATVDSDPIPRGVIPIAIDPGGNYLCFDFRTAPEAPPVVFWAHDIPDAPLQYVADSFTDLLAKLHDD